MVDAPKARLQEPLARVGTMLIRQVHQHRHEKAVSKDELALGAVAGLS